MARMITLGHPAVHPNPFYQVAKQRLQDQFPLFTVSRSPIFYDYLAPSDVKIK
jgi:hypothetical protein